MGRVGRYGQDCSRFKLAEVETLVNDKAARKLRFELVDMIKGVRGMNKKVKMEKNESAQTRR